MLILLLDCPAIITILAALILIDTCKLGLALGMSNLFLELELKACMAYLRLAFFGQYASLLKL